MWEGYSEYRYLFLGYIVRFYTNLRNYPKPGIFIFYYNKSFPEIRDYYNSNVIAVVQLAKDEYLCILTLSGPVHFYI